MSNSLGVDLSGLDQFNSASFLEGSDLDAAKGGHPLRLPLEQVQTDPEQPRKELDPDRLEELAASIKERGIKSPISVKPINDAGFYLINHGERRFRAAALAGLTEIPAFIDDEHDSYDQVIENIQREDLTPLEIAHFIERRLQDGEKKGEIAKLLGKPASYISDHALFFALPVAVRELYDSGRCRDIQALAALHRAAKSFPAAVEQFCQGEQRLTQADVKSFVSALKEQKADAGQGQEEKQPENEEMSPSAPVLDADTTCSDGVSAAPEVEEPEETDLEADLYQQFELHLKPLEDYLRNVTDPDFRESAAERLLQLAAVCGQPR
jgi:ParB family chromosome partitioning protein